MPEKTASFKYHAMIPNATQAPEPAQTDLFNSSPIDGHLGDDNGSDQHQEVTEPQSRSPTMKESENDRTVFLMNDAQKNAARVLREKSRALSQKFFQLQSQPPGTENSI